MAKNTSQENAGETAVAEVPVEIITPQDATAERIARGLNNEQRKVYREMQRQKKAKAQATSSSAKAEAEAEAEADNEVTEASYKTKSAPEVDEAKVKTETETITFNAEDAAPQSAVAEEVLAELSEDEMAKLDAKVRKHVTDASKESAKVRKRAQEAEARLKEAEVKTADLEARLTEAEKQRTESAEAVVRTAGLAGNVFSQFKDAHAVAQWAENAKDALALLNYHEREVKAGRRDEEDVVTHRLPTGQDVELKLADAGAYQQRVYDAQQWFLHDNELVKGRESASKLAEKHAATKGYKEARDAYFKDAGLALRIEELVAKAALYDVLQSRRAVITFPDTVGAANKAPSLKAEDSTTARKQPPSESPASQPRLAEVNAPGSDLAARKSLLMQKAMNAKTDDERQRYLKEAIKLGPMPNRARRVV